MTPDSESRDILRWLVGRKLYKTAMSFEMETGVSLLTYSGKLRLVRDLCFDGDFTALTELTASLLPRNSDISIAILVQHLKEDLWEVKSKSDVSAFVTRLERYGDSLPGPLYRTFIEAASDGAPHDHTLFTNWSGPGGRYELFEKILKHLEPLFPNDVMRTANLPDRENHPLSIPVLRESTTFDSLSLSPQSAPGNRRFRMQAEYKESKSSNPIRSIAFSNSGKYLAVGTSAHSIVLCDIPTMTPISRSRKLHAGSVFTAAWNADDSLLATGSNDQLIRISSVVRILENDEEERPLRLQLDLGTVRSLIFSEIGDSLIAGFSSDSVVRTVACESAIIVNRFDCNQLGGYVNTVARTETLITAACSSGEVCVFDSRIDPSRSRIWTSATSHDGLPAVADMCPLGKHVAIGSGTGEVSVFDLRNIKSRSPVWKKGDMHSESVRGVKFSSSGSWLASASFDKTVKVFSTNNFENSEISVLTGHSDRVVGQAWCKGDYLASSGTDARVVLWS